jgi:hypothetical protein
MATRVIKQSSEAIDPAEVHQSLEAILKSRQFVNAHKRKKFLRLICDFYLEGRAHQLNEYILAYDVFGRDNTYNPSSDPIVRVVAHEIRKKLEVYYQNEGANDTVHLEIPAGSYQPIFTRHPIRPAGPETAVAPVSPGAESKAQPGRKALSQTAILLCIAVAVLTIAVIALGLSNRGLRLEVLEGKAPKDVTAYGELWQPFMSGSVPPLVVLSNPPVLRLANPSDPAAIAGESITITPEAEKALKSKMVMKPEITVSESTAGLNDSIGAEESQTESVVVKRTQAPRLILSTNVYTGMGEAIGLHRITDLFRSANRGILLKQSRTLSAEDLKSHNVILLGGVWVNEWSGKLPENEDFGFTRNATVLNRHPVSGEEREYIPQFDGRSGALMVDYGLITVKPNLSDMSKVMILAGVYSEGTEAAAEYVTNMRYLDALNQRLKQLSGGGAPRYFQALLKVVVENGIPTTISVLAVHELRPSGS